MDADRGLGRTPERRPGGVVILFIYLLGAAIAAAMISSGISEKRELLFALGLLGLIIVLAVAPLVFIMGKAFQAREHQSLRDEIVALRAAVERQQEFAALSDDARRALNRRRERDLLMRSIEEDILAEDWDAAMVLTTELADRFGYRADAEGFRQRIEAARSETLERKVRDAIALLDGLIIQRRWDAAFAEAGRIGRLYPDSPRSEGLRRRVEQAKAAYKGELERRFLNTAKEDRGDDAIALLKELDAYLTPEEAERYREVARGVIGKARDNLGAEFKLAVQDRRWRKAVELGERIVEQFPNSRMAEEIRSVIDGLRQRAIGS